MSEQIHPPHYRPVAKRRIFLLRAIFVLFSGALLFTAATWPNGGPIDRGIRYAGVALILVCIIGRTWASLFIAGTKTRQLSTSGLYSVMRHPLYFFSTLGSAGVGAQSGSLTVAALLAALASVVFRSLVREEEGILRKVHGEKFDAYRAAVPSFIPALRLWQEPEFVTVNPRRVRGTFLDSTVFLLGIPFFAFIEDRQLDGTLTVLLRLP